MKVILELVRITVILIIFGTLLGSLVKVLYASLGVHLDKTNGGWLAGIAIILSLFVLYRNKLQFTGFYKGKEMVKLPRKVSITFIFCSVIMIVIAPFLN